MKNYSLFSCLLICTFLSAQSTDWQQQVDCKIRVSLDDSLHRLNGQIDIRYHNNAPDSLRELYFHLYPNAYSGRETAYAQQELRLGDGEFYFASDTTYGYLNELDFVVDGESVAFVPYAGHPDVVRLALTKPIAPGSIADISTPFVVQIPESYSRLGHVGTSYQMTQWYPKPAVYDEAGWHPMPYLDQGEFFSEFGDYEVEITLPANYVVGATGTLQTESEKEFLRERAAATLAYENDESTPLADIFSSNKYPTSSEKLKTLRYTAERVHDFAWFADKRFRVHSDAVTLSNGKSVETYVMYTKTEAELWREAINYVNRSVLFYSEVVGPYPYPQATAVQSALSAGGGMEYPMITVIGYAGNAKDLDDVITHEVGHNWFYGILASNEREHPWMDEGMNSYVEFRYMRKYYEGTLFDGMLPPLLSKRIGVPLDQYAYVFLSRNRHAQAPDTHSNATKSANYGEGSYTTPALVFYHLEQYLGTEEFDRVLQSYYETWKFRHPSPQDLQNHFEQVSGKNLDWLFEGYLQSTQIVDYRIVGKRQTAEATAITVKNKGKIAAPFLLRTVLPDSTMMDKWIDGFLGEKEVTVIGTGHRKIAIDPDQTLLDVNRRNNQLGANVKKLPKLDWLPDFGTTDRDTWWLLPTLGVNNYDKVSAGLLLSNTGLLIKPLEFSLLPQYSFAQGELVGVGDLAANFFPAHGPFQTLRLGLNLRSFHYRFEPEDDFPSLRYTRWNPSATAYLRTDKPQSKVSSLTLEAIHLQEEVLRFSSADDFTSDIDESTAWRLQYQYKNNRIHHPQQLEIAAEQRSFNDVGSRANYLKAWVIWRPSYTYAEERSIRARLFGGAFLHHSNDQRSDFGPGAFVLTGQNYNDYLYDEYYFGRSEVEGLFAQQVTRRDGGFTGASARPFANLNGSTTRSMLSLNLEADLPFGTPLKPYFDVALTPGIQMLGSSTDTPVWWSGGLRIKLWEDDFAVNVPLINSQNILNSSPTNFWNRISFSLDIRALNLPKYRYRLNEFF